MAGSFLQARIWRQAGGVAETAYPEEFWRSLFYFSIYRLIVAIGVLAIMQWSFRPDYSVNTSPLLLGIVLLYLGLCILSLVCARSRWPWFNWQLTLQVCEDVIFLVILMYVNGGVQSGLGLLLLATLAAAGLISRGKLTLFYASIASLGVLMEESWAFFHVEDYHPQYLQAALLGMSYFVIAWLSHQLAHYTITSEKLAWQRGIDLANLAEVNNLVIQDMQDGVLVVDGHGRIRQHNLQAEKLAGLTSRILSGSLLEEHIPVLAKRLAAWRQNINADFELLRFAGSSVVVRPRFVPVSRNEDAGTVIFLEDMSQVQMQAQQLKLAALGRLTASIAHEIRNPLSAISHASELLAEEHANSHARLRLLRIIGDNTTRLNKIVQNVLDLNRRDRGLPVAIGMKDYIRSFVADFCQTTEITTSTFVLDFAENQFVVNFDSGHLNQVLWNLCSNAWRHCQKNDGSIRLILTRGTDGDSIILDVVDDGSGVSPEAHHQLFEPFYTTAVGGTGLGLYISREIAESGGATLECLKSSAGGHFRMVFRNHVCRIQA